MRLFIAIPIPEDVKKYLISIQEGFHGFPLRFVKPEQMHLTIDFLGEIPDNKVDEIIKSLDNIRSSQFIIRLTSLGTFPTKEKIRVIWIGIEKDEEFIELQKGVRKIFNHRGKLMPHLTIARAREIIKDKRLSDKIKNNRIEPREFSVDRFILYKSEFQKDGVIHSIVKDFYLNDSMACL
jgi:2'-5' RNA ligase